MCSEPRLAAARSATAPPPFGASSTSEWRRKRSFAASMSSLRTAWRNSRPSALIAIPHPLLAAHPAQSQHSRRLDQDGGFSRHGARLLIDKKLKCSVLALCATGTAALQAGPSAFQAARTVAKGPVSHAVVGASQAALAAVFAAALVSPDAAQALSKETSNSLTYDQIKGTSLANKCADVVAGTGRINLGGKSRPHHQVQLGSFPATGARASLKCPACRLNKFDELCLEPKEFFVVESKLDKKGNMQTEEIVGKMMPRQTYTLPGIDGDLSTDVGKVVMKENDGIDVLASMASFYNKNPALGNSVMILFSTIVILRFQFEFFYWEKWFAVQNVVTVAVLNSTLAEHFSTFTHNQQRRDEEFGRSKLAPLQEAAVNTFDRALLYDCANAKIIEEHSVTNSADLKTSLTFSLGEDVENIMEVAHDFRINYSRSSLRKNLMRCETTKPSVGAHYR
ncbi:hypothetical protein T492DRAFT_1150237 [Pavlovales sp. CCMP2436]|nr:hypothetical protein T492DRAFT_1150237 [Pavlovales sp. CCMP2436]